MQTTTNPKAPGQLTLKMSLAVALAGGIAMWLWLKMPGPVILVSGCAVFCGVFFSLFMSKQPPVQLTFSGAELHIRDSQGQTYVVYDIPASDFVCSQSQAQKAADEGNIHVKNTRFHFRGVRNYSRVCAYIQANFPQ